MRTLIILLLEAHLVIVYVKALLLLSLGLDVDSLVVTAGQTILIKRGDVRTLWGR